MLHGHVRLAGYRCPLIASPHERARLPVVDRVAATVPRNLTDEALVVALREALSGDPPPEGGDHSACS